MTPGKKKSARISRRPGPRPAARKRRAAAGIPLQREHIVSTALALVDREGLKALSMRRLGEELGVDPMAVYYYLPNKQALLDAIVEAVMASIDLSVDDPAKPPEERLLGRRARLPRRIAGSCQCAADSARAWPGNAGCHAPG